MIGQLLAATRDRPPILPVYVSLTSGRADARDQGAPRHEGGGAPLLRGASRPSRRSPSVARWETRRALAPHRRAMARRLAGSRRGPHEPTGPTGAGRPAAAAAASARPSSRAWPSWRRRSPDDRGRSPSGRGGRPSPRLGGWARPVALKLDAVGVAHKCDVGALRPASPTRLGPRRGARELQAGAAAGPRRAGPAGPADGAARRRAHPRAAPRSAVRPGRPRGSRRGPRRGPRRRRDPTRAGHAARRDGDARRAARRRGCSTAPAADPRSTARRSRDAGRARPARGRAAGRPGGRPEPGDRDPAGALAVDALVVLEEACRCAAACRGRRPRTALVRPRHAVGRSAHPEPAGQAQRPLGPLVEALVGALDAAMPTRASGSSSSRVPVGRSPPATT